MSWRDRAIPIAPPQEQQPAKTSSWRDRATPINIAPIDNQLPATGVESSVASAEVPAQGGWRDRARKLPEEEAEEQDFVGALQTGIKQALLPYSVSKKEQADVNTKGELTASVVSDIGTSVAAGAGAAATGGYLGGLAGGALGSLAGGVGAIPGAAAGTSIGTLIGPLVYGLYSGLGRHFLRERQEAEGTDKEVTPWSSIADNPGQAALTVLLEANPVVKGGDKIARLARAGAQVVGEGVREYGYSKDAEASAWAAGLGILGGAGVYFNKAGKAAKSSKTTLQQAQTNSKGLGLMIDGLADTPIDLRKQAQAKLDIIADQTADKSHLGFQDWVVDNFGLAGAKSTEEAFAKQMDRLKVDRQDDLWRTYKTGEVLKEVSAQNANAAAAKMGLGKEPYGWIRDKISDQKFLARDIDRVVNLGYSRTLDKLSQGENKLVAEAAGYLAHQSNLYDVQKKLKVSGEDIGAMLNGTPEHISAEGRKLLSTPQGKDLIDGWRKLYGSARDHIEKAGYDIGIIEKYLPMKALKGDEMATAIRRQFEKYGARALSADESKDFVKVVKAMSGSTSDGSLKAEEVQAAMHAAITGKNPGNKIAGATAAFERTGDLPRFARQMDVNKTFYDYINTNLKALHLEEPIMEMKQIQSQLKGLGMDRAAAHLESHIAERLGKDDSLAASTKIWANRIRHKADDMFDKEQVGALGRDMIKTLPQIGGMINALFYPSVLGLNVGATARNATQSFLTTAPEIRGLYGQKMVARGLMQVAADMKAGKNIKADLEKLGLTGGVLRDATKEATGPEKLMVGAKAAGDKLMTAYSVADVINRAGALNTGKMLAKDALEGHKDALEAVLRIAKKDPAYGQIFKEAGGDVNKLGTALGEYLVGATQFHYGKSQMSQLAKAGGQLTSMFTKWPGMVSGDIIDMYKSQGFKDGSMDLAHKYLAPLAFVTAAGALADRSLDDDSAAKKTGKYLFKGPLALTPLGSISADVITNPLVKMGIEAYQEIPKLAEDAGKRNGAKKVGERLVKKGVDTALSYGVPVVSSVYNEFKRIDKQFPEADLARKLNPLRDKPKKR